jgi:hypothetical protein
VPKPLITVLPAAFSNTQLPSSGPKNELDALLFSAMSSLI